MNCTEAKKTDIVLTLKKLGHNPIRENEKEAWFLSPLRNETIPSFKVSKQKNVFYDFGIGSGGNLLDLLSKLLGSVKEALYYLSDNKNSFSFHQQPVIETNYDSKILINKVKDIQHFGLIDYLDQRKIPIHIARMICKEIHYTNNSRSYFSIGIRNLSGGWDLRNKNFKNASSPKDISLINRSKPILIITEGMFDMLSLLTYDPDLLLKADLMILNSTGLAKKAMTHLDDYRKIGLCLDNDSTGIRTTEYFLEASEKCIDRSDLYKNFKDPNEWLMSKQFNPSE